MAIGVSSSWFRDIVYSDRVFGLDLATTWIYGLEHQEDSPVRHWLAAAFALISASSAEAQNFVGAPTSGYSCCTTLPSGVPVNFATDYLTVTRFTPVAGTSFYNRSEGFLPLSSFSVALFMPQTRVLSYEYTCE